MKALTYIEHGKFALMDKPKPEILGPRYHGIFENKPDGGIKIAAEP